MDTGDNFLDTCRKQDSDYSELIDRLFKLQKQIKYGLPSITDTIIFEIGFSDRVIAQLISNALKTTSQNKNRILSSITKKHRSLKKRLSTYPSYYNKVLDNILAQQG